MEIIAECYANACIAEEILQAIKKELQTYGRIRHNPKLGRDRIIKKIDDIARRRKDETIIAVIDYEKGIAREYIDSYFKLEKLNGYNKLLVGISRRHGKRVLSIIFDPNIEEALLYTIIKELYRDLKLQRTIKSRKAYNILRKYINNLNLRKTVDLIAQKIIEKLRQTNQKYNTV